MKKILFFAGLLVSFLAHAQTPEVSVVVPTINTMKIYFGNATKIRVSGTKEEYAICSACSADETTVYAGVGGRKWERLTGGSSVDISGKVDKITGKGLSTNDYDNTEKAKVAAAVTHTELNAKADTGSVPKYLVIGRTMKRNPIDSSLEVNTDTVALKSDVPIEYRQEFVIPSGTTKTLDHAPRYPLAIILTYDGVPQRQQWYTISGTLFTATFTPDPTKTFTIKYSY